MIKAKEIVIVNQAVNYLTIGICNEFAQASWKVTLITGSIHVQGEQLLPQIELRYINRFSEKRLLRKAVNWIIALTKIYYLLIRFHRNSTILYISNPPVNYWLSLILRNKYSILIWDVYPDALKIFGVGERNVIYHFWRLINRHLFRKANNIYTVGNSISQLISQYVAIDKIILFNLWSVFNAIDYIPKTQNEFLRRKGLKEKFIVQYSGNIGITHNVEVLMDVAEKLQPYDEIYFQIIGRGHRTIKIKQDIEDRNFKNVSFLDFQQDDDFAASLSAADLGVVILDSKTPKGSVPSKTYNLMVFAKPILYIASPQSELYHYAMTYENGECLDKNDIEAMAAFILNLFYDRSYYQKLSRNSLKASAFFRRSNAADFVELFESKDITVTL